MEKSKNSSVWLEEGYTLFANEGPDGIQIERLARILGLNKSGFYHYFGDLDIFYSELLSLHKKKADIYLNDLRAIEAIDPGYLEVVAKHKLPVIFNMQLLRAKDNLVFVQLAEAIDKKEDELIGKLWSAYLGIGDNTELAVRYFIIVRDMAYARMSVQNLDVSFLRNLMTEARAVLQQVSHKGIVAG